MQTDTAAPPRSTRRRRPPPVATNSLLLVLPPILLHEPSSSALLPLFEAHFATYGSLVSWTPLLKLGRVVAVYEDDDAAGEAKGEMDLFVWEDEAERGDEPPHPLRVFYGPRITIHHLPRRSGSPSSPSSPSSRAHHAPESVLLTVPSSGKNFLISPPGSPPVGWEQIAEEEPNREVFHPDDGIDPVEVSRKETFSEGWADELARALRFLSVDAGGDDDDDEADPEAPSPPPPGDDDDPSAHQTTQLVLPPLPPLSSTSIPRPAVTVSSPPPSHAPTPPALAGQGTGARDITQVKATLESMLGRKRSASELRRSHSRSHSRSSSAGSVALGDELAAPASPLAPAAAVGLGASTGPRITPTARPPLA
ncbi:hypothetical protein JCM6882_005741 [Rhodosporidiobolus microsporus]